MDPIGKCPTPACFNSGTRATHCGLCAMCFAELTPARREDLIEAERVKNPPAEIRVEHVTNYVPAPRARSLVMFAALVGALAGAGGASLVRWVIP